MSALPCAFLGDAVYHPFKSPLPAWDYWYLLLLPLCLGISIVYKSIKCHQMRRVPRQADGVHDKPGGRFQVVSNLKPSLDHRRHHDLRDPVAVVNRVGLGAEVDKRHPQRTPIITVDRSGRIRNGDAKLDRKTRPRPDLDFVTRWNFNTNSGR